MRNPSVLRVGDVTLDVTTRAVQRGAMTIALTARETTCLEYFMRNAGRVLTPQLIEHALCEREPDRGSNRVRVYVRRLRAKLSPNGEQELIHTVRGLGYRFGMDDE